MYSLYAIQWLMNPFKIYDYSNVIMSNSNPMLYFNYSLDYKENSDILLRSETTVSLSSLQWIPISNQYPAYKSQLDFEKTL